MRQKMYFVRPRKDYDESEDYKRDWRKVRYLTDEASMEALKALWTAKGAWDPVYEAELLTDSMQIDFGGMLWANEPIVFVDSPDVCLEMRIRMASELHYRLSEVLPQTDLTGCVCLRGFHKRYLFSIETRDRLLPLLKDLNEASKGLIEYTNRMESEGFQEINSDKTRLVKMPREMAALYASEEK